MKTKAVSADEAVAIVRDGDTLANTGFVGNGAPEAAIAAPDQRTAAVRHALSPRHPSPPSI